MEKKFFESVFVFMMAEPYAMGSGGIIALMNEMGEFQYFDYRSEETPYETIKEAFPALQGCKWNGPMAGETAEGEIVLFRGEANADIQTRVNDGWHHIYLGFGNHLVIREDKWPEFCEVTSDLTDGVDIYGSWKERAKIMCSRNSVRK